MSNYTLQAMALIEKKKEQKTNHVLHLILSLFTCGIWIPVWILVSMSHSLESSRIQRKIDKLMKEQ